jgi:hypothetical protein
MSAMPSAVIDRVKRNLVGLRMPRALESSTSPCAASSGARPPRSTRSTFYSPRSLSYVARPLSR